ncbi:MAG: colanic acid biosynthesis acetyltransferase WcaF [Bacteroidia bacterium]|nr:colanic acid biosynthesis acetyltransferase WcaF [Bacteroidia bacterium]
MKKSVNLDAYNNEHFKTGAGKFKRMLWHLVNAVFFNSSFHFYSLKVFILKLFGAELGINVVIKPYVNIKYPWNLIVGNNVWIGENVWIDNLEKVQIGNNVCLSQGALLLCGNHDYKKSTFDLITGKIILEDGVWIGAKSIVCGNVVCHSHSVLSVNSVAAKDLDAYYIYKGNPAQALKERIIE